MHFKTKFLFLKEACTWVYFSLRPGIVLLREDSNGKSPKDWEAGMPGDGRP